MQINTCEIILDTLMEIREKENLSHQVLRAVLDKYGYLEKRDRAYISRVVNGTLEREITLDYVLNLYSKTPVRKMKPLIRNLMRSAVYQILYLDGVPCSAVVNSCVNLAGKRGFKGLKAYVNGVLRSVVRNKEEIPWPVRQADGSNAAEVMSIRYSMPQWIVTEWIRRFGEKDTEVMIASLLRTHATTVRVNTSRITADALIERLTAQGITVERSAYARTALMISGYDRLTMIPEFKEGLFQVQDIGSILIGLVSGAGAGMKCLDVCAAPGGKSLHMADLGADVTACDLTVYKTDMIRENVKRCKLDSIHIKEQDACDYRSEWKEQFDLVLADLPCSGLGVLGRKADLKYRINKEEQKSLVDLQRQILTNVKHYVKPGGYLLYSTCTIHTGENEDNVKWFLKEGGFEAVDLTERLPEALLADLDKAEYKQDPKEGCLQLLPGIYESDGMFLSLFRRSGDRNEQD